MANYCATARTNYFRVTDEEKYSQLFSHLTDVQDFTRSENGVVFHGFGSYESVEYAPDDEGDGGFDFFVAKLQEILPDGEAFIYTECGFENLRYITGFSVIATNSEVDTVDLYSETIRRAKEMLGNEKFETKLFY